MNQDAHGSRWERFASVLHKALEHRRLPWMLVVLGVICVLPSLGGGWVADDHHHRLRFHPAWPELVGTGSRLDLFSFADGDSAHTAKMMDIGFWPWWTYPKIKAAFFRPISVATHWLDYSFWPQSAVLMHVHSLFWFAALIGAVTVLFRRLESGAIIAGLASLLYVIDDARAMPVGFLANRNALLATLFGVLAILAHHRWRNSRWRPGIVIGPGLLAMSLLSAEAGIGTTAYLFAYAVFLDRGLLRQRLGTLIPYAIVVVVWRCVWSQLGYGVSGMGFYVDPLNEPLGYLAAVVERTPLLLAGQFFLPPSEVYLLFRDLGLLPYHLAVAVCVLLALGAAIVTRLDWDATTRFWTVGMLLSLLPACATFPADRMLLFVGLGAFAIIARFLLAVSGARKASVRTRGLRLGSRCTTVLFVTLVVVHCVWAPLHLAVRSAIPVGPPSLIEKLQVTLPDDPAIERQSVIVVTAPIPLLAAFLPERCALAGLPLPAHTRVLAPAGPGFVQVSRPDPLTLVVRPERGFIWLTADQLCRGPQHRMQVGEEVVLTGMTAEVTAINAEGRPAETAFRFDVPLEASSLRWLRWGGDGFISFTPPPVGESVRLGSGK